MNERFAVRWGWPLVTALGMLIDWVLWHRITHYATLPAVAVGYLVATVVLGRISAIPRWRWVWGLVGIPVLAWSFGMDFTGLTPWVWIAAWRRPAWSWKAVRPVAAAAAWILHLVVQWMLAPTGLSSAKAGLIIGLLAATGIGSAILWLTTRSPDQTLSLPK